MTAVSPRRVLHVRSLLLALAASILTGLVMMGPWTPSGFLLSTHLLVAFDVGVLAFLARTFVSLRHGDDARHDLAVQQDPGGFGMLTICIVAAAASIAAIVVELDAMKASGHASVVHAIVCVATIVLSFAFVHTAFALRYVHEHEVERSRGRTGLHFPGGEQPDDFDFLYFSFVIGVAAQTADVTIESRRMRRLAMVHGVVAFFFNTTLLALAVNAAASAF